MTPHPIPPKLFLDVDGVLNLDGDEGNGIAQFKTKAVMPSGVPAELVVRYRPAVVLALDSLIREFNVELLWLTSWAHENAIDKLIDQLGLLKGGRVMLMPNRALRSSVRPRWKREAVVAEVRACPAPYIWIDDDFKRGLQLPPTRFTTIPSLFLRPEPSVGLTAEHLKVMRNFLEVPSGNRYFSDR